MSKIGYEKPTKIDEKHMQLHMKKPLKIPEPETSMEATDKKNNASLNESPSLQSGMTKAARERWNCLCSPTTHVGSFRCRMHRTGFGMVRGRSVGSSLSELGGKSSASLRDMV